MAKKVGRKAPSYLLGISKKYKQIIVAQHEHAEYQRCGDGFADKLAHGHMEVVRRHHKAHMGGRHEACAVGHAHEENHQGH